MCPTTVKDVSDVAVGPAPFNVLAQVKVARSWFAGIVLGAAEIEIDPAGAGDAADQQVTTCATADY